jgi:hypothetical protein
VSPNIWLGRAWIADPVGAFTPNHPFPLTEPIVSTVSGIANATYNAAVQAIGFQGPNSTPTTSGGVYPDPVCGFWDCVGSPSDSCTEGEGGEHTGREREREREMVK